MSATGTRRDQDLEIWHRRRAGLLVSGLLATGAALAAGGHHALDDAVVLEPGTCQLESWLARADDRQRLLHAGGACRAGPLELGLAAEHGRAGGSSESAYQVQAKWATELRPGLGAGLAVAGGWQAHARPRYQATTVSALLSWFPRDDLALHLNLGRDFMRRQANEDRSGVGVEWAVRPGWSLTGERYLEAGGHFARAGLRWSDGAWSLDLSRARRLRGAGEPAWTLGATWQFKGP